MNKRIIAAGFYLILFVACAKISGYNQSFIGHGPTMPPGPDEPFLLRDGSPIPDCNPCPWITGIKHGPTMPPGPDEPIVSIN